MSLQMRFVVLRASLGSCRRLALWIPVRIQSTGSHPTIQGYGQAVRIPGSPVLPVVLACGAVSAGRPFPTSNSPFCFRRPIRGEARPYGLSTGVTVMFSLFPVGQIVVTQGLPRTAGASMVQFDRERSYGEGLASACNRELCMFRMRQRPPVRRHMAMPCPMICSFGDSTV